VTGVVPGVAGLRTVPVRFLFFARDIEHHPRLAVREMTTGSAQRTAQPTIHPLGRERRQIGRIIASG
jgi:hypothetical protein